MGESLLDTAPTKGSDIEHILMWCAAQADKPEIARRVLVGIYGFDQGDGQSFPNPLFLANGLTGQSPKTNNYLGGRLLKKGGANLAARAGDVAGTWTLNINVVSVARQVNSGYSSARHLEALRNMVTGATKQSETLRAWFDMVIQIKGNKYVGSVIDLGGSFVPVPGGALAANVLKKMLLSAPKEAVVARLAMEIHWRAMQEVSISSTLGGSNKDEGAGPASSIFYNIFTKYGATSILGSYDKTALVKEPAAWIALRDKLLLS